jgi:hypothetical protein
MGTTATKMEIAVRSHSMVCVQLPTRPVLGLAPSPKEVAEFTVKIDGWESLLTTLYQELLKHLEQEEQSQKKLESVATETKETSEAPPKKQAIDVPEFLSSSLERAKKITESRENNSSPKSTYKRK